MKHNKRTTKKNELHVFVHNETPSQVGRPPLPDDTAKRCVTVSLPPHLYMELRQLSKKTLIPVSALMRVAITAFLSREEL